MNENFDIINLVVKYNMLTGFKQAEHFKHCQTLPIIVRDEI